MMILTLNRFRDDAVLKLAALNSIEFEMERGKKFAARIVRFFLIIISV